MVGRYADIAAGVREGDGTFYLTDQDFVRLCLPRPDWTHLHVDMTRRVFN